MNARSLASARYLRNGLPCRQRIVVPSGGIRLLCSTSPRGTRPEHNEMRGSKCRKSATSILSPITPKFWASPPIWKRAGINTLRCLIGCTLGDFSAMWFLQACYPEIGIGAIMSISMASGLSTSMLLETILLRLGRDRLSWPIAAKTAAGMSFISMLTMEMAQNAVDYHLTGGTVAFDSPVFWLAAIVSMSAGYLAPLPYNYLRLRKYGKACH